MIVIQALWVVAVLALLVGGLGAGVHREVAAERRSTERAVLRAAAISGLEAYRKALSDTESPGYSSPDAAMSRPDRCSVRTANGVRSVCYRVANARSGLPPELTYGADEEESRLNPLKAKPDCVARLPGVTPRMAESLAERAAAGLNMPWRDLEDLRTVPGWEFVDLEPLRGLVTFFGDGRVNVNTASSEVWALLGVSLATRVEMAEFLAGPQRGPGGCRRSVLQGAHRNRAPLA